jgi:hypothetical protein
MPVSLRAGTSADLTLSSFADTQDLSSGEVITLHLVKPNNQLLPGYHRNPCGPRLMDLSDSTIPINGPAVAVQPGQRFCRASGETLHPHLVEWSLMQRSLANLAVTSLQFRQAPRLPCRAFEYQ